VHSFDFLNIVVLLFWLTFYLYWFISARGMKKDMPGKGNRRGWVLPRLVLLLVALTVYKLRNYFPYLDFAHGPSFFRNEAVRTIGVVLNALGLLFAVWARVHLGRNWSAKPP
jgi:protein-S-isoprenylcysteine O-methyltransferase Ste14